MHAVGGGMHAVGGGVRGVGGGVREVGGGGRAVGAGRRAVYSAVGGGLRRHRLQSFIIAAVAFLSVTTGVLAAGLLVASTAPFDAAFARVAGAHVTATFGPDPAAGDPAARALAATASAPGVTAAAGPFTEVTAAVSRAAGSGRPPAVLVGRADQAGPVDQLTLDRGAWLTGPGQIVLSREYAGPLADAIGQDVVLDVPGSPRLRLIGIADSITATADGWIWPAQADALAPAGDRQMLYRFAQAATADDLRAELDRVTAGLGLTGSSTYLTARTQANRGIAPFVPFVVAFAVLGIVLSALISANVVSGAVLAATRAIGVYKAVGFTPAQVVAAYVGRVLVPSLVGCGVGAAAGILLAVPVLAQTNRAYDLPGTAGAGVTYGLVPVVMAAVMVVIALAAVGPALRAGRLPAHQAITVGRAPAEGSGHRLRWVPSRHAIRQALSRLPLPRPVAIGLGLPFARPGRSLATLVAVLLGAVTLVFAVGLSTSLHRVHSGFLRTDAVPVVVDLPRGEISAVKPGGVTPPPGPEVDPDDVYRTVLAAPGTARAVGVSDVTVHVVGIGSSVTVEAYAGPAQWTGYPLVAGRWYGAADEMVASSYLLRQTGHRVSDRLSVGGPSGQRSVLVVGSYLDGRNGFTMLADAATLSGIAPDVAPTRFEVGLAPGVTTAAYVSPLQERFGPFSGIYVDDRTQGNNERTFIVLDGLIATLALLLGTVAGLGVLNTVVLTTRERVHELGVLKALGMTPGQTQALVVVSTAVVGLIGGIIAVPLGVALQHRVVPMMAAAAGTDVPSSIVDVYRPLTLVGLASAGIALAVLGSLLPAGWAARGRAAAALRAE
jgi:putative ABC transport system permease protein